MSDELVVKFDVDGNEIKLSRSIIKNFLTNNQEVTLQEFKLFSELCKVRKLNPFLKEAYIIKFGTSPAQIVVGKEAIIKRALQNKNFDGREQGIIVLDINLEVKERIGSFLMEGERLLGGWAKVYRKDITHPTYITVGFDEVAQKKADGSLNSNWEKKPATMVEKVALVRALRETFVEEIGGMISEDEAWSSEDLNSTSKKGKAQKLDEAEILEAEVEEGAS